MEKRIREFCELASLYIPETGGFLTCDNDCHGPKLTKPFEEWGIKNFEDWDNLMNQEVEWLKNNKNDVLKNLNKIEHEWSRTCKSIRYLLKS